MTARFTCLPGSAGGFIDAAREVMARTKAAEPGCLDYTCCRSVTDDDVFVFVEQWQDPAALGAHAQSAHYMRFAAEVEGLVKDRVVELHVVERSRTL